MQESSLLVQYHLEGSTQNLSELSSHSQLASSVSTRRSLRGRLSSNQENVLTAHDSGLENQESLLESTYTSSILYENSPDDFESKECKEESVKKPLSTRNSNSRNLKIQKSPKNDLADFTGVKALLKTPKVQKSPQLKGLKKLMGTPVVQRSPKNELNDFRGLKKLMESPVVQRSPKNDLTNVKGVKKLMASPRDVKSPKNELDDLEGVKEVFDLSKDAHNLSNVSLAETSSTKNERLNISGVDVLQDENGDTFDKLCGRKSFNTYRGKSLSPIKQKLDVLTTRMSMGNDLGSKKPEIERWLKEQRDLTEKRRVVNDTPETKTKEKSTKTRSKVNKVETKAEELEQKSQESVPQTRKRGRPKREPVEIKQTTRGQNKQKVVKEEILKEVTNEVSPPRTRRRRNASSKNEEKEIVDVVQKAKKRVHFKVEAETKKTDILMKEVVITDKVSPPKTRQRRKAAPKEKTKNTDPVPKTKKGAHSEVKAKINKTDVSMKEEVITDISPPKTRQRRKVVSKETENIDPLPETKKGVEVEAEIKANVRSTRKKAVKNDISPRITRQRKNKIVV